MADLRGRRLSVILSFFICGSAVVGAGLAGSFVLLMLTQVLWAFGSTFRSGAETAWFTDEVGSVDIVDQVLPRRGKVEAVGSIVGLVVTAVLAAIAGLSVAIVVVGSLLLAWGAVLIVRMPETGFQRHHESPRTRFGALLREGLTASGQPGLKVLLIVTVMAGMASEAVDRLYVARLDDVGLQDMAIDPALLIGSASVFKSVGAIALLFLLASRLAGQRLAQVMVGLNIVTALAVAVLAQVSLLSIALGAYIAQGMVRSVAETVTIGWTNRSNRATVQSFVGQAQSLGEISGGIALGVVAQQAGIGIAMSGSAILYLTAASWATRGKHLWPKTTLSSESRTTEVRSDAAATEPGQVP